MVAFFASIVNAVTRNIRNMPININLKEDIFIYFKHNRGGGCTITFSLSILLSFMLFCMVKMSLKFALLLELQ